ncbi:MAG TPA: isocitrate lyase/PEP mutase family protein [Xanthobacteraceae bacterium]|jgi:carboxyvinyl-carboxyphosphonate phosphorylmutase|nr:isocitrate lyase/PEP mutase family protein [Xanthobacteraceae bacterium]
MQWTERRRKFRALLAGERCIYPASVFDPISARIAEDLGFEAGMFAGSIASMTVLGAPDLVVLTLSEFAQQIHRICRASSLPLMVDADHGYGNALNVMRTVEELETVGLCAMTIEDTLLPPTYGGGGKGQLISVEEGVGKMRAALAARRDPNLVIVGRTSAIGITGLDDAIKRVCAYAAAGVDAVFLVGVQSREQLDTVADAVNVPILLGSAGAAVMDDAYLSSCGVRICLKGHQPFAAAVQAVYATMEALRKGTPPRDLTGLASPELMKRVTRDQDYKKWSKEFLGD